MSKKPIEGMFTSPPLPCRWARLFEPRDGYEGAPPYWQIALEMHHPEAAEFKATLEAHYKEHYAKLLAEKGKKKANMFDLFKEPEDGVILLELRRKTQFEKDGAIVKKRPPTVFDAANRPFPSDTTLVGNGSVVRVQMILRPFLTPLGYGLTKNFHSVQVVKLDEYVPGGASPFDTVEGGYVAPAEAATSPFAADDYVTEEAEFPF